MRLTRDGRWVPSDCSDCVYASDPLVYTTYCAKKQCRVVLHQILWGCFTPREKRQRTA